LTCEATGNPQPTLKWIKFNSDVNLSSKHIIVFIRSCLLF
jgi:hypothetical protein